MSDIRTILLAEDSLADAEMAIDALREANLANPIVHVEDGVEALDYLLLQQCTAGFFPETLNANPDAVDQTCDGRSGTPSIDATE